MPSCPFHAQHWGFPQGLLSDLLLSLTKFPSAHGSSFTDRSVPRFTMELCQLGGLQFPGHDAANCSHRGTVEWGMAPMSAPSQGGWIGKDLGEWWSCRLSPFSISLSVGLIGPVPYFCSALGLWLVKPCPVQGVHCWAVGFPLDG